MAELADAPVSKTGPRERVRVRVPPRPPKIMQATDLKTGTIFQEKGIPFKVEKYEHIKVARGSANVKVKARNLINGNVIQKGYLSSDKVEDADVITKNAQFLYKRGNNFVFMDPNSYEQVSIPQKIVGEDAKFIGKESEVRVLYFEGSPIAIELPKTVVFEVEYTEPAQRGNTVSNAFKDAKLVNGAIVKVPMFIKISDKVKINTDSGEYVSRE